MELPTIDIKDGRGGRRIINLRDFNHDKHVPFDDAEAAKVTAAVKAGAIAAPVAEAAVEAQGEPGSGGLGTPASPDASVNQVEPRAKAGRPKKS